MPRKTRREMIPPVPLWRRLLPQMRLVQRRRRRPRKLQPPAQWRSSPTSLLSWQRRRTLQAQKLMSLMLLKRPLSLLRLMLMMKPKAGPLSIRQRGARSLSQRLWMLLSLSSLLLQW